MTRTKFSLATLTLTAFAVSSTSSWGAGFEKAMMWSGKAVGRAGAVVGDVSGAEALYFNPAGLASMPYTGEVSLNFSPTLSNFEGPIPFRNTANTVEGRQQFSPVFGGMLGMKATPQLGFGAGIYVSGGTRARFVNLDYTGVSGGVPYTLKPTVETNLAVTEAALGAGYEVLPGLRFGLAWRYVMVKANFSVVQPPTGNPAQAIANVSANDLDAKRWNAFKIGAQYTSAEKKWGLGANFRSPVKFTAKGTTSGVVNTAGGAVTNVSSGEKIDVTNTFPLQIVAGGFYQTTDTLRLSTEYSYTNYSENDVLQLSGTFAGTALSNIAQNWKNQHVIRLGAENAMSDDFALRAGYALTTQVTPDDRARNTFASPGLGHSITLGAGMSAMDDYLDIDAALEYSFASGDGTNPAEAITTAKEYSSKAYALHAGVTYRF